MWSMFKMWRELTVNDTEGLIKFANIRNLFGCSNTWDKDMVIKIMTIKKDCHMFLFESEKYDMVVGFKKDVVTHKIVFIAIALGYLKVEDNEDALKIMGLKIRDYLVEKKNSLYMPSSKGFDEKHPNVLKVGFDTMISYCVNYWAEIGLITNWTKNNFITIEVDG